MVWEVRPIEKPYSRDHLQELLEQGERGTLSAYSHWQIVSWCSQFTDELNRHEPQNPLLAIADDVVVQWELHLAGQYTVEQMQRFSQNDLLMPREFFTLWLDQLNSLDHL